jgi:acyl transferase domain-containing protein
MSQPRRLEVAIVGMGCRFPGARDLCEFWENILSARDCIRPVPPDRWDPAVFADPSSSANDRVPSSRGGYLDSPIWFDARAHGIMPRTVEGGEPEQFLVLDAAMAALADAQISASDLAGRRVEIVIGRGNYFNRGNLTRLQHGRIAAQTVSLLAALHPEWPDSKRQAVRAELKASLPPLEAATIAGQLTNATAGRLAHRLGTISASYVVDAASASSLIALDLATRVLVNRQVDLAIVGAVYVEADIDFPLVFRQLGALSHTGQSRPFSADADGMLSGEGVGVLVLKRRSDAERSRDRIYAVVQGLASASDGRGRGLIAPSARGHARAIRRSYRRSGIDPATVMLVEGHGLGVPAADRAEIRALNAVFPLPRHGRRTLGAVSSMIGHSMPAAGIAGLIKTALALYHRVLPPTLHGERPHQLLAQPESAFTLSASPRPWIHPDPETPRRAGVNAFGFAGINAHAVLEEHARSADSLAPGALRHWDSEAILLAAPDRLNLIERARELLDWLESHPQAPLVDVAYTLNCGRGNPSGSVRLGLVATSSADLARRVREVLPRLADPACRAIRDGRGAYHWHEPLLSSGSGGVAFLFPGEGSQYPGMLADLCLHFPEVRRLFDTSDRIALELGESVPPSVHLFGSMPSEREELRSDSTAIAGDRPDALRHVAPATPSIFSATTAVNVVLSSQWALYQLLSRLGLRPDAVAGHSSGELLALAAAGVLQTDRELEQQLGRLGAIFRNFESAGDVPAARLVAVAAGRDQALATCHELGAFGVTVAIDNCPHQVVLAGPPAEVEAVVRRLTETKVLWEDLPFGRAYHTPGFAAVLGPVAEFFSRLTFRPSSLPIYSCATRERMPADPAAIRDLAVAQWTRAVAFRETITAMHADGLRVFIDVGARGNLAGFVEDTLRGQPAFAVAANLPRRSGLAQLNNLIAATFAQGASVDAGFLYARRRPREIDWNAPEPEPRATVELKLGFPEMRLSESFVERLRSHVDRAALEPATATQGTAGAPCALGGTATWADTDWSAPAESGRNGAAHDEAGPGHATSLEREAAMFAFQDTMRAFLRTQHDVITAYLADASIGRSPGVEEPDVPSTMAVDQVVLSGPESGAWTGEVRRLVAGSEVQTVFKLDARDDPIAQNHTLGGRRISAVDPSLKGLAVLPFAVMAEMAAQTAALTSTPGLVLIGLEEVIARKWVRYEEAPVHLELCGRRESSSEHERIRVAIFNRGPDGKADAPRPVFEAIAIFAEALPAPVPAAPWNLDAPRASRFTAKSLYSEQWLFHGPPFQALVKVGQVSEQGIEGKLRILPWEPLVKRGQVARLHTDVIVVDSFTHLLGCWGLDCLAGGDVVFPLRMGRLEIHGDRPPIGIDVSCRISVRDIQRHRVRVQAEIVRPDGTLWMRINDWEDWRFHWPSCYRDVFRQPRDIFVGEELALQDPMRDASPAANATWLAPPADMGRPVWRDVLEQTQLAPSEHAAHLAESGGERRRAHRLWGRIAAKEAARRLWVPAGLAPVYPADLVVLAGERGRPRLGRVDSPDDRSLPAISIAHADGVSVALAALDPGARIGIDLELLGGRTEGLESSAFSAAERALLDRWAGPERAEWVVRFRCARSAATKAAGISPMAGPRAAEVVNADDGEAGAPRVVHVRLSPAEKDSLPIGRAGPPSLAAAPETAGLLRVITDRRGEYVWAWTLGEGTEPS